MDVIYPEYIMRMLRQRLGLEPNDTSRDEELSLMTPSDAFEEVLEWNGLIGFSSTIKAWIEDTYGFNIDEVVG